MVSVSPRLRDSSDYEDPGETDPRLYGFRSLSLQSTEYDHYDPVADHRPYSASPDPLNTRRTRRQRRTETLLRNHPPFTYRTRADGDTFRLAVIKPGSGTQPIDCQLIWESSKSPRRDYKCLSYCWQTPMRDVAIICDGFRLPVTKNLLAALRCVRKPRTKVLIWIDQICINQGDVAERAQQVSVMKQIFNHCKQVIVWLGEDADNSGNLCDYAKKMRRGDDGPRSSLSKILTARQLETAIQRLLERPWFYRAWVIPEVCLAPRILIVIGNSQMSWENITRLVRDVSPPQPTGFAKQIDLPGNARQRIAILTQMIAGQRDCKAHTDISQLLVLAKSSQATEVRDKVYAFYGITVVSTTPDYTRSIESLYTDIAQNYINNIEALYDGWRDLTETQRTFQIMSILYSAGALHQRYALPSWVPDWSFAWYLAPIWCTTTANMVESNREVGKAGIRSEYRAGGTERDLFEIIDSGPLQQLRLSALLVDQVTSLGNDDELLDPVINGSDPAASVPQGGLNTPQVANSVRYMRIIFRTARGFVGVATQGIDVGDYLAILLGGDVPVILRHVAAPVPECRSFRLLCECLVRSHAVMFGDYLLARSNDAETIVLV